MVKEEENYYKKKSSSGNRIQMLRERKAGRDKRSRTTIRMPGTRGLGKEGRMVTGGE